nr:MAG TPA: hypothetical protein [Caudoviricetes sp.]
MTISNYISSLMPIRVKIICSYIFIELFCNS